MLMPVALFSVHGVSNVYSAHMSLSMVPGSFLARLYGDAFHSVQLWKGKAFLLYWQMHGHLIY